MDLVLQLVVETSQGVKSNAVLRHTLKLLVTLLADPTNGSKFAQKQGPAKLLAALVSWLRLDTRVRHPDIRKSMIAVLARSFSSGTVLC